MKPCLDKKKKKSAQIKAQNAINNGKIKRHTVCFVCGTPNEHNHAHHEDYDKLLDIIFLCPRCHINCHKGKSLYAEMVQAFIEEFNPNLRQKPLNLIALCKIRALIRKARIIANIPSTRKKREKINIKGVADALNQSLQGEYIARRIDDGTHIFETNEAL